MSFDYLTVNETAAYADVTKATVYNWIRNGVRIRGQRGRVLFLTAAIIGGQQGIHQVDLDGFLDSLGYEREEDESDEDKSDQK